MMVYEGTATMSNDLRKLTRVDKILCQATDDRPFTPSKTRLSEIAARTHFSVLLCDQTTSFLKTQLERVHIKWRCYFRVLVVVEFILHLGAERSVTWALENLDSIKVFGQFTHTDKTAEIRVQYAAREVLALLSDKKRLLRERFEGDRWHSRIPELNDPEASFMPLPANQPTSSWEQPRAAEKLATATIKHPTSQREPLHNPPISHSFDLISPTGLAKEIAPIHIWKNRSGPEQQSEDPWAASSNPSSLLSRKLPPTLPEASLRLLAQALSSSSKAVVIARRSDSAAAGATPSLQTLGDYFNSSESPRIPFSDFHCEEIARLLSESGNFKWSGVPRLYTILRLIDQLQKLNKFIDQGVSDICLPLKLSDLTQILGSDYDQKFVDTQPLVLTKFFQLRNGGHAHLTREDAFPFEIKGTLGEGRFGFVDRIANPLDGKEYARKRFRRNGWSKIQSQSFLKELNILKRIRHVHTVELFASYTDPKYFGIIMAPVADQDLNAFYRLVTTEDTPLLRSFFGCLACALNFLHESKVRHRDIKPQNILVKGPRVYLTDFGISLDWEDLSRGTTMDDPSKTPLYCAPEVARSEPRNQSSDVWSLGCVFLEMLTLIKGHTIEDQQQFFKQSKDNARFYENLLGIQEWVKRLQEIDSSRKSDLVVAGCILRMLKEKTRERITAVQLYTELSKYQDLDEEQGNSLCGECCVSDTYSVSDSGSDGDPLADTAGP